MNFIYLSPHFPPNYYHFCVQLRNLGVNVLGLADEPYHNLRPELKSALSEYYQVPNMHDYDQLLRACGLLTNHHGRIDRLESLNEYWLETEAQLRTDFNISGIKNDEIVRIKRKSIMKEAFIGAGIPVARGKIIHNLSEAKNLIDLVGFPVVAKPDIGVGAAITYKIHNLSELKNFFAQKPAVDYIMEEFIQGRIFTYDGLTDKEGNIVFSSTLTYSQGIMEVVNNDDLVYYYTLREIPDDLNDLGRRVLKAFNVRERFFHFEFFRTIPDERIVALEVNLRPPGGLTTDMWNYANDIDIYAEWAHLIVYNRFTAVFTHPYYCCYIGRKQNRSYVHSHAEILTNLKERICHYESISGVFSRALGDFGYLVRSPDLEDILNMANYIQS